MTNLEKEMDLDDLQIKHILTIRSKENRQFSYTFWKGIKNELELTEYVNKKSDCPECEMFRIKSKGDDALIKGKGFIEKAPCDFDDKEWEDIPLTLKDALGVK